MEAEYWTVGPEYEDKLFDQLGRSLRAFGYEANLTLDALAGSQDLACWKVSGPEGDLTVKSETYIGLTVEGARNIMSKVRKHFECQPADLQLNTDTFGTP